MKNIKNKVRLTESQLHNVIKESVKRVLNEMDWKTYADAERKWADHLMKNPSDKRRKSSIVGHKNSTGTHDITTDDRLRSFQNARRDAFNRDYGYNVWGSPENLANGVNKDMTKGSYEMEWPYEDSGKKGYYDRLRVNTETPSIHGQHHKMGEKFYLDSIDGNDPYPGDKHETRVSHVNGRYAPNTFVNRPAVEPEWSKLPYMDARNKGNEEIMKYINGDYVYDDINGKWTTEDSAKYPQVISVDALNNLSDKSKSGFKHPWDFGLDAYVDGELEDDLGSDLVNIKINGKQFTQLINGNNIPCRVIGIDRPCEMVNQGFSPTKKHYVLIRYKD